MRILFCNKYNFRFSGTEVYLFELMELLRTAGHEVALFSMQDPRGQPSKYDDCLMPRVDFKKKSHGLGAKLGLAAHAIYSVEARRRLRRLVEQFRPDVAHVRNIYHHLSPSIFWELRALKIPVLYHVNDFKLVCPSYNLVARGAACDRCQGGRFWHVVSEGCYNGPPGSSSLLAAEAYVHKWLRTYERCVDRFLAPSEFVRDRLALNGVGRERIDVLYHFQKAASDQIPPSHNGPVLYFGRLSREKGLTDLLYAARQLPDIAVQIAGEGPQRAELETLAHDLGLQNVSFLGYVQGAALQKLIAESSLTVLPSRAYETMGKTILESYAQARPVIATDLGSRRELVVDGKTGLLYEPGNCEQLEAAISFLQSQPSRRAEMGKEGRNLVLRRHSPEQHYTAMMAIYDQMVTTKRGSARPKLCPAPRPNLRIAFIGGRGLVAKYSGIESYYEEVGKRLAQRGHDVTVYCRSHFTPPLLTHQGMRVLRLPSIHTKHLDTLVHTALSTVHALFGNYDVVHYHTLGPALFSFIPRLLGKKTVVTVQGLDWQRKKWGPLAARLLRLGERAAVRLPDSTMVVSQTLGDFYERTYGARPFVVPNGTRLRTRTVSGRLADWGLEPANYILFLGRFSPEKNCDLLIRAYERLHTDAKLVFAGGSSHCDDYVDRLKRHASEHIHFLDWVSGEALDELLTNAVIFVLPSDLEGLSLALLDAMGAGVCVLTSDIPENRELVDGAGFTFRRSDEGDLARMLEWLISDPQVRQTAATAGRERIRERYLWPQIAGEIEQQYFEILGWKPPQRRPPTSARTASKPGLQRVS